MALEEGVAELDDKYLAIIYASIIVWQHSSNEWASISVLIDTCTLPANPSTMNEYPSLYSYLDRFPRLNVYWEQYSIRTFPDGSCLF